MKCPKCNGKMRVALTIPGKPGRVVRKRVCKECGYTANSEEQLFAGGKPRVGGTGNAF